MTYINLNEQLLKNWNTKDCPQEYLDIASGKNQDYRRQFITFGVPTECYIVSPKIVFPIQGRMWDVRKVLLRGVIVDYDTLKKEHAFNGIGAYDSAYDSVYLTEIWDDIGDDGHLDYVLVGYGLTSKPEEIKKYYSQCCS